MSETMKMKELKERLHAYGYDISERMIKYYIEIGILPIPDYTHPNQAKYSPIHLIRLKRIGKMKQDGMSFNEIKTVLLTEAKEIEEMAQNRGIPAEEMRALTSCDVKEEADFIAASIGSNKNSYSRQELLDKLGCEKIIFDLAVDTGALEEKNTYDQHDYYVLLCVRNLIEAESGSEKTANIIEKIGEISKLNNMASQMVHYYKKQQERTWLYSYLFESLIDRKLTEEKSIDSFEITKEK
ncbi:MAG: MerR family transcriptional regulator [Anaerofustis sp.]